MKINIITFGCRLNACESETIEAFLKEIGNELGIGSKGEITLINTCAVTAEAERKLRQTIRRIFTENPDVKIILTGCAAELHREFYMGMDGVVGVVSNESKLCKDEYKKIVESVFSEKIHKNTKNNSEKREFSGEKSEKPKKVRGFLQIQNGCDQKCTYCVVRLTRGPNVSFDEDEIVEQARVLIRRGYKDIVLTGVNISAYGRDMSPRKNLAYIMDYILRNVAEIKRLGLSSVDPADMDDDLIDIVCNEKRVLPHIHESIQSGDDMILKRMMRRHSRQQVIDVNRRILERRPEVVFGADIICGFPTETDEMFENTKKLMYEAHITLLHAFPYSKRPGTPAARMPEVDRSKARERVRELKMLAQEVLKAKLQEVVAAGQGRVQVLAEDAHNAKTDSFLRVVTPDSDTPMTAGEKYEVVCERVDDGAIVGKCIL